MKHELTKIEVQLARLALAQENTAIVTGNLAIIMQSCLWFAVLLSVIELIGWVVS